MQNYKLSVSKNGKKYTIVLKAETEIFARERVHKEGYSILGIEKIDQKEEIGNLFIFSAYTKSGDIKNGKIIGDDIFKIYVKLKNNLEYDVKLLYSEKDENLSIEEKEKIIKDLEEEYKLYYKKSTKIKSEIEKEIEETQNEKNKDEVVIDNFYLKKELEEVYKLIDFVLLKIQNLVSNKENIQLDSDQIEKLNNVYNSIVKIKKSTNLSKLREVGEIALLKIGKIELDEVERTKDERTKKLLKQTNILLKKIGSKETFIEKDKDLGYIINNFFEKLNQYFINLKNLRQKKEEIDKNSHSYIKNILFLKRYKEKLKENNIYILKNFFTLLINSEKRLDILIRRKVIKQNITIFKAKEKGVGFSYTTVKNGISIVLQHILNFIKNLKQYLFYVILLYIITFIIFTNINYYTSYNELNFEGLFYFIIIFFVYFALYFTRNFFLIILNFVILFFIIIFGVVNF